MKFCFLLVSNSVNVDVCNSMLQWHNLGQGPILEKWKMAGCNITAKRTKNSPGENRGEMPIWGWGVLLTSFRLGYRRDPYKLWVLDKDLLQVAATVDRLADINLGLEEDFMTESKQLHALLESKLRLHMRIPVCKASGPWGGWARQSSGETERRYMQPWRFVMSHRSGQMGRTPSLVFSALLPSSPQDTPMSSTFSKGLRTQSWLSNLHWFISGTIAAKSCRSQVTWVWKLV